METQTYQKSVPLFMQSPLMFDDAKIAPVEGVDYTYDAKAQRANWITCGAIFCPTLYGDTKIDGYTYVTPDGPSVPPNSPPGGPSPC